MRQYDSKYNHECKPSTRSLCARLPAIMSLFSSIISLYESSLQIEDGVAMGAATLGWTGFFLGRLGALGNWSGVLSGVVESIVGDEIFHFSSTFYRKYTKVIHFMQWTASINCTLKMCMCSSKCRRWQSLCIVWWPHSIRLNRDITRKHLCISHPI